MYGCSNCGSPCGNKPMVLCDDCYKIDEEVIIKMANRRDQALDDLKAEIANHREDTALLEAMRETAKEANRVHIEMHNQITALQAEVARTKRTATEAALRWAFDHAVYRGRVDDYVRRGLAALLGEGKS